MMQILQNAVHGTVMILAVAVLRGTLKNRLLPEARLALWAVCLFRLFTPTVPTSALSFWGLFGRRTQEVSVPMTTVPAPGPTIAPSTGVIVPVAPNVTATAPVTPAETGTGVSWVAVLATVWISVGVILAMRYVLAYVRTRRAVGNTIPLESEDARYAALPKCARLREGPMEGAPLTFGVVRPTVVLSPDLDGMELACVLAHEGVHAQRRDNLWHYAAAVALTVFWWNPAVWLMARLIRRDVELSCDRAAVRRLGADRRAEYANALVTLSTQAEGRTFCHGFGLKRTEERIISVMKYRKATITSIALTLALVLAVTVGFASNPGADVPVASSEPATLKYEFVPHPVNDNFLRVNVPEGGFYYDMPADGWDDYGPYFLVSAHGTDSRIEIYGTGEGGFEGEVELYKRLNYTKIREIDGLTLLAQTEVLEWSDGSVSTVRREVYIFGQKGPDQCWVVELTWVEENLTEETANEPGIMRAVARSFTIGTDTAPEEPRARALPSGVSGSGADADHQDEVFVCTRENCPFQSVHFHNEYGKAVYVYKSLPAVALVCPVEGCTTAEPHIHADDDSAVYLCNGAGHENGVCDGSCYINCNLYFDCAEVCTKPGIHLHKAGDVFYVCSVSGG